MCVIVWHVGAGCWNNVRTDGSRGRDSCSSGNLGLSALLQSHLQYASCWSMYQSLMAVLVAWS